MNHGSTKKLRKGRVTLAVILLVAVALLAVLGLWGVIDTFFTIVANAVIELDSILGGVENE